MILAERLFMFFHIISYKWVDGKSVHSVQQIEEKISNFDHVEADLIALNADEDSHVLYNGQSRK